VKVTFEGPHTIPSLFQTPTPLPFPLHFPLLPSPPLWLVGHIDIHHLNNAPENLQEGSFPPADSRLPCIITAHHDSKFVLSLIHTCHAYPFDTSFKLFMNSCKVSVHSYCCFSRTFLPTPLAPTPHPTLLLTLPPSSTQPVVLVVLGCFLYTI
jgi:hypothetical protein